MNKITATTELEKLVRKYITDPTLKTALIQRIKNNLPSPPVRGVIDEIYNNKAKDLDAQDKELIDDLMYFFG